jgi:hypothetical protein
MLNNVVITNSQGNVLVLYLAQISSGLVVTSIEGLDPPKATLVSSTFSTMDGAQYQGGRGETRNIKFRLGLEPDWSVENVQDVRRRVYEYFMPKSSIKMHFFDDASLLVPNEIFGIVESVETPLFTSDPAVDISVMCFEPDFVSTEETIFSGNTVSDASETILTYEGTVETGFEFHLDINNDDLDQFTIKTRTPNGLVRTMDFAYAMGDENDFYLSTVPGSKYVELTYLGNRFSILHAMDRASPWIDLKPGINYINVYSTTIAIPYTISYFNRYGGL